MNTRANAVNLKACKHRNISRMNQQLSWQLKLDKNNTGIIKKASWRCTYYFKVTEASIRERVSKNRRKATFLVLRFAPGFPLPSCWYLAKILPDLRRATSLLHIHHPIKFITHWQRLGHEATHSRWPLQLPPEPVSQMWNIILVAKTSDG